MWYYLTGSTIQNFSRLYFFHIGPLSNKKLKRNKQKVGEIHLSHLHPQQQTKMRFDYFLFYCYRNILLTSVGK